MNMLIKSVGLCFILACKNVYSDEIILDKQVSVEPLSDNAVMLNFNDKNEEILINMHLVSEKKGVPAFVLRKISDANTKKNVFNSKWTELEVKKMNQSIVVKTKVTFQELLTATGLPSPVLSWNEKDISLFRGDWIPLYYNKPEIFCIVRDKNKKDVYSVEIIYNENRSGTIMWTREIDGVLQSERTTKNK